MDVSLPDISLPDELADFVKAQIGSGRYASSSEVLCDALRLMAVRDAEKLKWLQNAWDIGVGSGDAGKLDAASLKRDARHSIAEKNAL